jgi:hypothetical protein
VVDAISVALVHILIGRLHKQGVKTSVSLLGFQLGGSPFKFADLTEVHQVQGLFGCCLDGSPHSFIVKLNFKSEVEGQINDLAVVKPGNEFTKTFAINFFGKFFDHTIWHFKRRKEITDVGFGASHIGPMVISLGNSE